MFTKNRTQLIAGLILILLLAGAGSARSEDGVHLIDDVSFGWLCSSTSVDKGKACDGATRARQLLKIAKARADRASAASPDRRYVCFALCGTTNSENQLVARSIVGVGTYPLATYEFLARRCDLNYQFLFHELAIYREGNRIDLRPAGDVPVATACWRNPHFDRANDRE